MQILLFGNKGQVGQEIEELAVASSGSINVIGYDLPECDITDVVQVVKIFQQHTAVSGVDIVINAAAYTAVDKAEDEPEKAYAVNCDGVKNLALACKELDVPLLHISTDYVFSGNTAQPYRESEQPNPLGTYGKSKLAGDEVLKSVWEKHIILRVSWVFGKHGANFVKTILRLVRERDVLKVVGDQHGCPTAAADIARVLLELAVKIKVGQERWGVYNYCGYPATTWYDFACKIVELGGEMNLCPGGRQVVKITTAEYPTRAQRPINSELQVKKIINDYGIERRAWLDGLKKMLKEM